MAYDPRALYEGLPLYPPGRKQGVGRKDVFQPLGGISHLRLLARSKLDPKLKDLASAFKKLDFTAYELKDEATFNLEMNSTGRMQLPSQDWMTIKTLGTVGPNDKLRLQLEVKKLKFKTTVAIDPGATLAVGGPPFQDGALILAVTRANSAKD